MTEAVKGVYLSRGKSEEEIAAILAAWAEDENRPYKRITLSLKEEKEFEAAASNAEYLLSNAATIFEELENLLAGHHIDPGSPGLRAMMEMLARGYRHATDDEGEKLSRLAGMMRRGEHLINAD